MCEIKNKIFTQDICQSIYEHPLGGTGDFCICFDKGIWHLFHILHEYGIPISCHHPGQTSKLAHATSPDLVRWDFHEPAIQARPGKWDNSKVWAPGINKFEKEWYMCYTGVDNDIHQKIGIVKSNNLWEWTYPIDEPIIDASKFPWSQVGGVYEDSIFPKYFNCRDPFILEHDNKFLCYYTARTKNENNEAVVGLATSVDFINWQDVGYVLARPIFNGEGKGTYMTESPFVFKNGEYFFLVFNQGEGVRYCTSNTPYDFSSVEPRRFVDHIINFDLIDISSGLFAYSQANKYYRNSSMGGAYQHIRFGLCEIKDDLLIPV